ncbi:response regulator CheY-like domain-containing protein (plasmid) [Rhizobium etli]|uniref:Response regulator CheY-like domain-containing protein n=1 Tax=Rhizobium etli TaxID=29449 RepID=A0AAN1BN62_RHIET|nr:response regulator protein [Rhizobium etli bv. mimosae str. Mim1]ARQ14345.1 response regulator CheY-like domain-containing protein [Rhizobium etli]
MPIRSYNFRKTSDGLFRAVIAIVPERTAPVSLGKKIVAIVDDDEAMLEATSGFLEAMGYDVLPFGSGEAFLESPRASTIDVLLTDINMPGMSGLDLQTMVRVRYPALPVIMMTALRDDMLRRRVIASGAKALLQKPILADDLVRCLEAA